MYRPLMTGLVICGALLLAGFANTAEAGWGSHGSSGGSSGGSWGSTGGSSGGSWGSGGGSWGSHGGLFHRLHNRWHHRHHARHWGSSGGSWGSSGGSWGSSGGSSGGSWGDSGTIRYYAPQDMPAGDAPPEPPMDDAAGISTQSNGLLTVRVPTDAEVFVNGKPTTSTGPVRTFVSRGLEPGFRYTYEVRAVWQNEGQPVELTKTIQLQSGANAAIAFTSPETPSAETTLTVRVPAEAKVYLSGVETSATGPVRSFKTNRLQPGRAWEDYQVRVTLDRDGQTLSKEQTITLNAGETRELSFDFDAEKLADAR